MKYSYFFPLSPAKTGLDIPFSLMQPLYTFKNMYNILFSPNYILKQFFQHFKVLSYKFRPSLPPSPFPSLSPSSSSFLLEIVSSHIYVQSCKTFSYFVQEDFSKTKRMKMKNSILQSVFN